MALTLTSPAFPSDGTIPRGFTCDGDDEPPPLVWAGAPDGTRSFALIMDDPDAPGGTFTHWLAYDIPPETTGLPAKSPGKSLHNDFGRAGYGGPCPPRRHGPHRYVFTLYAVDVPSLKLHGRERGDLDEALRGHALATAQLVGRYQRA